jgi:hypothetical protein
MTTENLDFEAIMVRIAQVLKIDSIELLKNLAFEKSQAEKNSKMPPLWRKNLNFYLK